LNSSIVLLHTLRGKDVPTKIVREAVASGLPIVETVLGEELKPISGPDLRSKPFPVFARLTVQADNIKLKCLQADSGRPIEFVPIVVVWTVEGQPGNNVRRWIAEEDENYYYGVRLDEHRGDIFFYFVDGIATHVGQGGASQED